jgi:hypothetical protein
MGASGWDYRMPFNGSVEQSFVDVQEQVLASGDYIWPWDDLDADYEDEGATFPRPTSLAQLVEAKEADEFWDEGTHTLLDLDRVSNTEDADEFGAVRPLTSAELIQVFGTERPSAQDFDRVHQLGPAGPLGELAEPTWSGRSLVIYRDDSPAEVHFWGWSGD